MKFKQYISTVTACLLLTLLTAASASAQAKPELKASIDKDSILIGDHITLSLSTTIKKQQQAGFPIFTDTIFPGLELVKELKLDTLKETAEELSLEKRYIVTSFDSARYSFSLPFIVRTNSSVDTIESNTLELYVNTIPIDTTTYQMADIKAPIEYPYTFREILPWLLLGLVLLLLILFVAYVVWRRRKNKPIFSRPKPVEPPYIVAIRELQRLKEQKLWQQENSKQYYSRLIDILRVYIEGEFSIPMMEKTSKEILELLGKSELLEKYPKHKLNDLFNISDLAKFAKYSPAMDENERSFTIVYEFVEATKPAHQPQEQHEAESEATPVDTVVKNAAKEQEEEQL